MTAKAQKARSNRHALLAASRIQMYLEKSSVSYSASTYPYDTIVFITDTIGTQSWQGSGVLISPDEVLTASHVVYTQGVGTATNIVVTPGYEKGSSPYGSATGSYIHFNPVADANRLISSDQSQIDYAVIHLSTPFANVGYMGIQPDFGGGAVNITGYPASASGAQIQSTQIVTKDRTIRCWMEHLSAKDPAAARSG